MNLPECECYKGRLNQICNGLADIPPEHITIWREQHGLAPIGQDQATWNVTMKSRGLGDTIAKFTHYTGIAKAVQAVSTAVGVDCGCGKRQDAVNQAVPFKDKEQ